MRFTILGRNGRNLTRSAAILAVGALSAGCSSSAMRFDEGIFTDRTLTGSTANQRQIISKADNQPFPGDAMAAAPINGVSPDGVSGVSGGAVQRSALAPAAGAAPAQSRSTTVQTAAAPDNDPKVTKASAAPAGVPIAPADARADSVAVLPQTPKLKESAPDQQQASTNAAPQPGAYTVIAGDTLFGIARKTGASAEAIKSANGLTNGFIRVGQMLTIPGSAAPQTASAAPVKVDPQQTATASPEVKAAPAAYTPPAKAESLVEQVALNADETAAPNATGIGRMRWPVRGRVIAGFGGSGNDGIDIAVPAGTPIKAAENGVVIYAGNGLKEFGNTVLVRHEDGLVTVYGHASDIKVARGETVRRGQEIALSGMSGSAETPKLHFEVRENSAPVDPTKFLE